MLAAAGATGATGTTAAPNVIGTTAGQAVVGMLGAAGQAVVGMLGAADRRQQDESFADKLISIDFRHILDSF
jgi:hypothetical protein